MSFAKEPLTIVLCLDHADAPGKKILISGGGRCNFTNVGAVPERYLSTNPHFARSALARADFDEEFSAGRQLSLDDAIKEALTISRDLADSDSLPA